MAEECASTLATLPQEEREDLLSRILHIHDTWKVLPLNPDLAFEQVADSTGRGIPDALARLHLYLWGDQRIIYCPELAELEKALRPVTPPSGEALKEPGREDRQMKIVRDSGWVPPDTVTLKVDLRTPFPDLADQFEGIVVGFQVARHKLLGIEPISLPKSHWKRIERGWKIYDHVVKGGSIAKVTKRFRIAASSARRDFLLAAKAIGDVATSLREARRMGLGMAKDWQEIDHHFKEHPECPAKNFQKADDLKRCPQAGAILGPTFQTAEWDWTSSEKGKTRLMTEGKKRRRGVLPGLSRLEKDRS